MPLDNTVKNFKIWLDPVELERARLILERAAELDGTPVTQAGSRLIHSTYDALMDKVKDLETFLEEYAVDHTANTKAKALEILSYVDTILDTRLHTEEDRAEQKEEWRTLMNMMIEQDCLHTIPDYIIIGSAAIPELDRADRISDHLLQFAKEQL